MKGNTLGLALVQLGSILNEMTKRAGVASRRNVVRGSLDPSFIALCFVEYPTDILRVAAAGICETWIQFPSNTAWAQQYSHSAISASTNLSFFSNYSER